MSVFTAAQLAYLGERRLARIATVGADGTLHVTPVGMWSHNPVHDSIDVTGREFARSKKYRDVARAPGPPSSSTIRPAQTPGGRVASRSAAGPRPSPNPTS